MSLADACHLVLSNLHKISVFPCLFTPDRKTTRVVLSSRFNNPEQQFPRVVATSSVIVAIIVCSGKLVHLLTTRGTLLTTNLHHRFVSTFWHFVSPQLRSSHIGLPCNAKMRSCSSRLNSGKLQKVAGIKRKSTNTMKW